MCSIIIRAHLLSIPSCLSPPKRQGIVGGSSDINQAEALQAWGAVCQDLEASVNRGRWQLLLFDEMLDGERIIRIGPKTDGDEMMGEEDARLLGGRCEPCP